MSDQREPADEHVASGEETVVVPRVTVPDDATVVVPRVVVPDDATVVVSRVAAPLEDATVVVPHRERRESAPSAPEPRATGDETEVVAPRPAPGFEPVADPEPQSALPGAQSLPARTVYAARSAERQSTLGSAAVGEHIGLPPEASYVADAAVVRQQLPSIARRSKRRRILTLVGYAATLVVSVAGLAAVINMAVSGS